MPNSQPVRSLKADSAAFLKYGAGDNGSALLPVTDPLSTCYSLLSRLEDWKDDAGWKLFFDRYSRFIFSIATKSGLTESEAQEVVQETVISVANSIQKFKRDPEAGSFRGWLRNIIRWRIADQLKKRNRAEPIEGENSELSKGVDAHEEIWEEEWQRNLFAVAIGRLKSKVKEEHYLIFDLHLVRRLPAAEVARTLNVSLGQVYLIRRRMAALVKKEIQNLERECF